MIGSLAAFAVLAPGPKLPAAEFSTDLFLVAGNERPIMNLGWMDKPENDGPIEALLRTEIVPLTERKSSFIIIDGGDCSLFPASPQPWAGFTYRSYGEFVSKRESRTVNGKTITRDIERTGTEHTTSAYVHSRPLGNYGYVSRSYAHFGSGDSENTVAFQDLNSLRNTLTHGQEQDRKDLGKTILISRESIEDSRRFLADAKYDFKNVCISARGLPRPEAPNFIAFPPEGVVAHYKLIRNGDRWSVSLVEYLRAKDSR